MALTNEEVVTLARTRVGKTLRDKYRIDDLLGVGGMAAVYSATHRNGREVAVKVLHPLLAMHADIRKRFLLEGHAANAVKHPAVVAVLDDDVDDDGTTFLVMELLRGQSIEELWESRGQRLPADIVLAIAAELCEALTVAHESGIVHRDLKPANLFLMTSGQVKVLDFGLARLRDVALGMTTTATGTVFGTPAFLPPEQAAGRTSAVDARTDIWALGATMFTLLSGHTVHDGESAQNLVMNAATRPARSLATVLHDAAPPLVALVDRALAFEKTERWTTATEMGDEIRRASEELFGAQRIDLAGIAKPFRNLPSLPQSTMQSPQIPARRAPGVHTTSPVSSAAKESGAQRRAAGATAMLRGGPGRGRRWLIVGALGAAAVLVALAPRLAGSLTPTLPANATSVLARPDAHDVVPPAETPAQGPDIRSVASSAEPTAPLAAPSALADVPTAVGKPVPARATAPRAPKGIAKPSCDPPYHVDPNGKRIWKRECF